MNGQEILTLIFGCVFAIIALIAILLSVAAWFWHLRARKRDRAMQFLTSLLTDEFLIRARLVSEQYLLAAPQHSKYAMLAGKNYEEIDAELQGATDAEDRAARVLIRAVPDFFEAVHLAREQGFLCRSEKLFSRIYAWYWVNIMEERVASREETRGMYREHKWMRTERDVETARRERIERMRRIGLS